MIYIKIERRQNKRHVCVPSMRLDACSSLLFWDLERSGGILGIVSDLFLNPGSQMCDVFS